MKAIIIYILLFLAITIISKCIYEIAKVLHCRWLVHIVLFIITLCVVGTYLEDISDTIFSLINITMYELIWFAWKSFWIKWRVGITDTTDFNYSTAGVCLYSQWILVCIAVWKVPIEWLCLKANSTINVDITIAIMYIIYFLGTIILYNSVFKGYKMLKGKLKKNGILEEADKLSISKVIGINDKLSYVENILIRMRNRKFIYKLDFSEEIYVYKKLYNIIYSGIRNDDSKQTIYEKVLKKYKISQFDRVYDYIYGQDNNNKNRKYTSKDASCVEADVSESKINNNSFEVNEKCTSTTQDKNLDSINIVENLIDENEIKDNILTEEETEFMVLRSILSNHPLIQESEKVKEAYLYILNYLVTDITNLDKAWIEKLKEYEQLFNVKINKNIELVDIDYKIEIIARKIYKFKGFLQLRINDYKYLLILEAMYYKSILNNRKIDINIVNSISQKFNINEKDYEWINKYISAMFINKNSKEAELLFLNCKNKYIRNTILYVHSNAEWNNIYVKLPRVNVAVCATMSSGKSTFVNALLGKDFIPSKNEACTAKVTTIRDNDKLENLIGCFYNDSGNIVYSNNINSDTLIKWNEDDTVKRIVLEADIEEIECRRSVIVMHDTPGTNNSQDISHYERTMNFLKETNIDIMLYLINAEHISTTDTEILIKQLKSEIVDKGNTKVLFLLNKADSFDIERGEELLEIIKKIEEELVSYGFTKPLITPISSNAARLFKLVLNGSELTKKEVNDFKNLMEYFSDEEIKFSSYSNFSQKIKENKKYVFGDEDNSIKVGKNEYRRNDIIKALQYTGINVVESWLDEQIN